MLHQKLECIEVISIKEPIQHLDAYGNMIIVVTNSHELKVTKTITVLLIVIEMIIVMKAILCNASCTLYSGHT